MPCLSRDYKNHYNFIRWKSATTLDLADIATATTCNDSYTGYSNNFLRNCKEYYPSFLLSSQLSVYANLDTPNNSVNFSAWRVRLYDWYGTNSGLADITPTKDDLGGGDFNFYFSSTPTSANFEANKLYRFVIYENSGNTVVYVSNWFRMRAAADAYKYTGLSYRNSTNTKNFNYEVLTSFRNKVWVDLNLQDYQPELEFFGYKEITTGNRRNSKVYTDLANTFKSDQFDYESMLAMLHLSECDDILLNGNEVEVKEAYKPETNIINSVHNGVITFYDQGVSTINLQGYLS